MELRTNICNFEFGTGVKVLNEELSREIRIHIQQVEKIIKQEETKIHQITISNIEEKILSAEK